MAPTKKTVKRMDTFMKPYIHKICNQIHPDLKLNALFVNDLNHMAEAIVVELVHATIEITQTCGKSTLGSKEVEAASGIILKGVLKKHARSEGTKAVKRFTTAPDTKSKVMKASKAGLRVSPTRVKNLMEEIYKKEKKNIRCSEVAAVFMAAVLEYLLAEILEVSGNAAKDHRMKVITTSCMYEGIEKDSELRCSLCK